MSEVHPVFQRVQNSIPTIREIIVGPTDDYDTQREISVIHRDGRVNTLWIDTCKIRNDAWNRMKGFTQQQIDDAALSRSELVVAYMQKLVVDAIIAAVWKGTSAE